MGRRGCLCAHRDGFGLLVGAGEERVEVVLLAEGVAHLAVPRHQPHPDDAPHVAAAVAALAALRDRAEGALPGGRLLLHERVCDKPAVDARVVLGGSSEGEGGGRAG